MKRELCFFVLVTLLSILSDNKIHSQCVTCQDNTASKPTSSAIGYGSQSLEDFTFTSGYISISNHIGSQTIGSFLINEGNYSVLIGEGFDVENPLINSSGHSIMMGTGSNVPSFYIGPSYSIGKTGKIGIGNVISPNPNTKVHIRADEGEAAVMLIEPNSWGSGKTASLALGNFEYGITGSFSQGLVFSSSSNFLFQNGMVGIGAFNLNEPEAKVHIKCAQGEQADLYIEPYKDPFQGDAAEGSWQANLYMGNKEHGVMAHQNFGLVFDSEHDFVFREGVVAVSSTDIEQPATISLVNNQTYFWALKNTFKGTENTSLVFNYNGLEQMRLTDDGKLVLGQGLETPEGYSLYVDNGILAKKVKVAVPGTSEWSDHVFDNNYQLMEIKELEQFINENNHLPGVPSAEEVVEEGVDLLEMNAMLLEKVEELTLYIIEQQKQINELKNNQENR
jgi:hypothetical protein